MHALSRKELIQVGRLDEALGVKAKVDFVTTTMTLAHTTINEGILVSLLSDSELTEAEKTKKVEQCMAQLEKGAVGVGDVKSLLHPVILKASASRVISIGR